MPFTGIVLVVTFILCHTQTVEKQKHETRQNATTGAGPNNITMNKTQESTNSTRKKWKFEEYLKKFEPGVIWEHIDKQKKYKGLVISDEEQSEIMYKAMDSTDELLDLKIEKGDPKMVLDQNGRRVDNQGWKPWRQYLGYKIDHFQLRNRLHELMKQAIYTSRNKMVIMQIYREKYRNSSLYKMGVLFNKADNAVKVFGKYSFRAYRGCLVARERVLYRAPIFDLMAANERQMHLWFNCEILADLIYDNDLIAQEVVRNTTLNRWKLFDKKFID